MPNPFRGQYRWQQREADPVNWPIIDSYVRYAWRELEGDRQDSFDFSAIARELSNARRRRGRFGFRIMLLDTTEIGSQLPAYLTKDDCGWWCRVKPEAQASFIPDWNSEGVLCRWEALMKALGNQFRDDPNLGIVDIGGYGNWGEWHDFPYRSKYPGPRGQMPGTERSIRRLIDAVNVNFPENYLVIGADHPYGLRYALGLSSRIGTRVDCLGGDEEMLGGRPGLEAAPEALVRWKTAPVVTEWCNNIKPGSNLFRTFGLSQVREFHVATLSSGNYHKPWSEFSPPEKQAFMEANLVSGYRIAPREVTLPSSISRGTTFRVASHWENTNVTPAYGVWHVTFELRVRGREGPNWSGKSILDLRRVTPTEGVPVKVVDSFNLPGSVAPGSYEFRVRVVDPTGATEPMRLAIEGRERDGGYTLGSVKVEPRMDAGSTPLCSEPTWAFAVISDAWGGLTNGTVSGLESACQLHPEIRFVVGAGDLKDLGTLDRELQRRLKPFFPRQPIVPWFTVLGNHNVEDKADTDFVVGTLGARLATQLPGLRNLKIGPSDSARHWTRSPTTYSFDYENAHFVMLNEYLGSVEGQPKHPLACAWNGLLTWLSADLASTGQPAVFVVGHEPAFVHESSVAHCGDSLDDPGCPGNTASPPNDWKQIRPARDRFWQLLRARRVVAYVEGHTHESSARAVRGFSDFNTAACIDKEWNCYCQVEKEKLQVTDGATIGPADGVVEFNAGLSLAQGPVNVVQIRCGVVTFRVFDRDRKTGRLTPSRSFQYVLNPPRR